MPPGRPGCYTVRMAAERRTRVESRLEPQPAEPRARDLRPGPVARPYAPPSFELIPLDCEITAYAPSGDEPLF